MKFYTGVVVFRGCVCLCACVSDDPVPCRDVTGQFL